jgi:DeoR/GlpR family transcriptional regulator of sugar metabolism
VGVRRRHGGAVANDRTAYEPSHTEKAGVASDEKAAIADLAAELVSPGDAVVIGAGTTTLALAKRLARLAEPTRGPARTRSPRAGRPARTC